MITVPALLLLLGAAFAVPACAQVNTGQDVVTLGPGLTQTAPVTSINSLPISLPPGAVVQMEIDGQDADLLGMVKSLLAGAATPKTGAKTHASAGSDAAGANPFLAFLSDGRLSALLKDIHHLHVLSFKPADPSPAGAAAPTGSPANLLAFYEKPFEAEGGHRLLYLSGSTPVVTVGFDQPRGFAAVVQSSGTVFVVRADGYPDMAVVGSLLRAFGGAVPMPGLMEVAPAPISSASSAHKAPKKAGHAKARRA